MRQESGWDNDIVQRLDAKFADARASRSPTTDLGDFLKNTLIVLLSLVLLTACQESPTGRSQLALVPDTVLANLGASTFEEMKQQNPVVTDAATLRRVQCVADALVVAATRLYPDAPFPDDWEVVVFEDPTPNAFALPGGKIGVHAGLFDVARTADQLAAVIGHEVAHVLAEHGNERLTQELGLEASLFLVGLFTESELAEGQLQQALGLGAQLGILLPFSRAHEEEADRMGLAIMARAGFDPRQSVRLWQNMAAASGSQPVEFLSTHPSHDTRIDNLSARMTQAVAVFEATPPASCGR